MRESLAACLDEGGRRLAAGGSALDSVESAVRHLEDDALFNAGRGSVLTAAGRVEMDASIMDGRRRAAGAVGCVWRLAHPVSAARLVMERSPHVLLVGEGAEAFAAAHGAERVRPEDLVTEPRRRELERVQAGAQPGSAGTVGAVALDESGHLAAATSTGGLTGQLPGRIGDSAAAGAGTWADDDSCAVSGTGHGEAFIRSALAHEVDAGLRLAKLSLEEACRRALARVTRLGFRGGLVAVDRGGAIAAPFTTPALFRGWVRRGAAPEVRVFADD
jgi:isoaspartyl peptidase/L-asparaginase-like protein (Ntn-hydrolase superfamily)